MRNPTGEHANRLARAVADDDQASIDDLLGSLSIDALRALAIELALRAGPTDTDAELVTTALHHAARIFGTTPESVLSGSRRREDTEARQVTCYTARLLGCSYQFIGRQIGRDHSTVMAACVRVGETARLRGAGQRIATRLGWDRNAFEIEEAAS